MTPLTCRCCLDGYRSVELRMKSREDARSIAESLRKEKKEIKIKQLQASDIVGEYEKAVFICLKMTIYN